jgi:hypothetical protein
VVFQISIHRLDLVNFYYPFQVQSGRFV